MGPIVTAPVIVAICKTVPIFSTKNTKGMQVKPKKVTIALNRMPFCLSVKSTNGFTKSSEITQAIEFKPVDRELKAALNTPATKRPGNPGTAPNMRITSTVGN